MPRRAFLMVGPPGCGKGTQGRILGSILGFRHLSSGDVFRDIDRGTKLGRYITSFMERGELIPNDVTIDVFNHHIERLILHREYDSATDILILDGIPRNLEQARMLEPKITMIGLILMELADEETVIQRLYKRATEEHRLDDADEGVIRHRIDVYKRNLNQLLSVYPAENVIRICGEQSPIKVHYEITRELLKALGEISA